MLQLFSHSSIASMMFGALLASLFWFAICKLRLSSQREDFARRLTLVTQEAATRLRKMREAAAESGPEQFRLGIKYGRLQAEREACSISAVTKA